MEKRMLTEISPEWSATTPNMLSTFYSLLMVAVVASSGNLTLNITSLLWLMKVTNQLKVLPINWRKWMNKHNYIELFRAMGVSYLNIKLQVLSLMIITMLMIQRIWLRVHSFKVTSMALMNFNNSSWCKSPKFPIIQATSKLMKITASVSHNRRKCILQLSNFINDC